MADEITVSPDPTPESQNSRNKAFAVKFERRELHVGPLPPASELAAYETALKGSANRILKMAEAEALHGRTQENRLIFASIVRGYIGQASAIVFTLTLVGCGAYLIATDHDKAGFSLVVAGLTPALSAFLPRFHKSEDEPKSDREARPEHGKLKGESMQIGRSVESSDA